MKLPAKTIEELKLLAQAGRSGRLALAVLEAESSPCHDVLNQVHQALVSLARKNAALLGSESLEDNEAVLAHAANVLRETARLLAVVTAPAENEKAVPALHGGNRADRIETLRASVLDVLREHAVERDDKHLAMEVCALTQLPRSEFDRRAGHWFRAIMYECANASGRTWFDKELTRADVRKLAMSLQDQLALTADACHVLAEEALTETEAQTAREMAT